MHPLLQGLLGEGQRRQQAAMQPRPQMQKPAAPAASSILQGLSPQHMAFLNQGVRDMGLKNQMHGGLVTKPGGRLGVPSMEAESRFGRFST